MPSAITSVGPMTSKPRRARVPDCRSSAMPTARSPISTACSIRSTGRNFDEILRVVDSLQLTDTHKVATPVNWKPGEDVIIVPSLSNDEARKLFPQGWNEQRPYLRTVKLAN